MKYLNPSFSSGANSDAYRKGWDEIFGKKKDSEQRDSTVMVDVKNCARCGEDHDQLPFAPGPITFRGKEYSHAAACPSKQKRILLVIEEVERD
jgi:hypothetical protein